MALLQPTRRGRVELIAAFLTSIHCQRASSRAKTRGRKRIKEKLPRGEIEIE